MALFAGGERNATHAMLPVFIPLLLPLTIIAIPMADLILAIVRRTWNGQSPFAADRGHLHHRLLELGHSHSRAVLIMYFWSGLIAFGAVAYSVHSTSMWIVLAIAALSAVGLILLLLPRFTPRTPRWAEFLVPPRYRHSARRAEAAAEAAAREATAIEPPRPGPSWRASPESTGRPRWAPGPASPTGARPNPPADAAAVGPAREPGPTLMCTVKPVCQPSPIEGACLGVHSGRQVPIPDKTARRRAHTGGFTLMCDSQHTNQVKLSSNSL